MGINPDELIGSETPDLPASTISLPTTTNRLLGETKEDPPADQSVVVNIVISVRYESLAAADRIRTFIKRLCKRICPGYNIEITLMVKGSVNLELRMHEKDVLALLVSFYGLLVDSLKVRTVRIPVNSFPGRIIEALYTIIGQQSSPVLTAHQINEIILGIRIPDIEHRLHRLFLRRIFIKSLYTEISLNFNSFRKPHIAGEVTILSRRKAHSDALI